MGRKTKTEPEPAAPAAADQPHVARSGAAYFCPKHGIRYAETRQDGGVDRCVACGAPVTRPGR